MKRWIAGWVLLLALLLAGCSRYEPSAEIERSVSGTEASDVQETAAMPAQEEAEDGTEEAPSEDAEAQESSGEEIITLSTYPPRNPVKVKGIYVSAYVAGTEDRMDAIIEQIDATELNAVVIDVKDDQGRITFSMDSPTVNEIGAVQAFIGDMPGLIAKLKEHGIYPIARVVAFRDPYLAEQKPEWSLHKADGSIYRDSQGLAWVNPYKKEVWDYLIEVARKAGEIGFEEIQFDYIRFAVDSTMRDVVYDEADTQGRDKTQAIMEFITYAYDQLAAEGLFVSADVFGTIIGSQEDAASVGQDYSGMAEHLDYICPMIYPSHYGPGNFGIDYPDTQPYETVYQALLPRQTLRPRLAAPARQELRLRQMTPARQELQPRLMARLRRLSAPGSRILPRLIWNTILNMERIRYGRRSRRFTMPAMTSGSSGTRPASIPGMG